MSTALSPIRSIARATSIARSGISIADSSNPPSMMRRASPWFRSLMTWSSSTSDSACSRSRCVNDAIAVAIMPLAWFPITVKSSSSSGVSGCCTKSRLSLAMLTHWSPIRSRFWFTWMTASTNRRSTATGDWRASSDSTACSTWRYTRSTPSSPAITLSAASDPGAISASRAPSSERWHRRASSLRRAPSSASSWSNVSRGMRAAYSPEMPGKYASPLVHQAYTGASPHPGRATCTIDATVKPSMEKTRMKMKKLTAPLAAVAVLALAAGCGGSGSSDNNGGGSSTGGKVSVLTGAGSTLVYPLVSQWEPDYATKKGVTITYGAIGSGGGIEAITGRTVDFGASDAPLSSDQATACKGCLQIPWALGATVVTYNVKGVDDHLKLTGQVVADMFTGKVTSWNDPAIASLNPGVNLPDTKVTPVYRSDGSGDSYVFTSYLSAIDPSWKSSVGASTQPAFPTGTGAEKNSGVAAAIQSTDGAIGYVAISYIAADSLHAALLKNAAGKYPVPGLDTIAAAAAAVSDV